MKEQSDYEEIRIELQALRMLLQESFALIERKVLDMARRIEDERSNRKDHDGNTPPV